LIFAVDLGHERGMPSFPLIPPHRIPILAIGLFGWLCAYTFVYGETQGVTEVSFRSSADDSLQWTKFFAPPSNEPVPLVVALHTWSSNWKQTSQKPVEDFCVKNGWAYLHPDFRGPNRRPQATGSDLVIGDIVSAVEYACKQTKVDKKRIFLFGASGGGYTSLVMSGKRPDLWAGVSAWVPISDLRAWHKECKAKGRKYFRDIELSCGGAPGTSPKVDQEYAKRSPLTFLKNARGVNLSINAGILDGHKGSVPISHSLLAFNEVAEEKDRLSAEEIKYFTEKAKVPKSLAREIKDSSYGKKTPLFRRSSGTATVTIFQGGHEWVAPVVLSWLEHENKRILKEKKK
jgi:pimeloyl-ACP methyl ester carboxylesterase